MRLGKSPFGKRMVVHQIMANGTRNLFRAFVNQQNRVLIVLKVFVNGIREFNPK